MINIFYQVAIELAWAEGYLSARNPAVSLKCSISAECVLSRVWQETAITGQFEIIQSSILRTKQTIFWNFSSEGEMYQTPKKKKN